VEEIHIYADSEAELAQWIAAWQLSHLEAAPKVFPIDHLSAIVQSRKPFK
jgi:hypothetical protein